MRRIQKNILGTGLILLALLLYQLPLDEGVVASTFDPVVTGELVVDGVLTHYYEEDGITEVVLSEGIHTIGEEAFLNCSTLTSITLPSTVLQVEEAAFAGCVNLETLTILSGSEVDFASNLFSGCIQLQEIQIDEVAGWFQSGFFVDSQDRLLYYVGELTNIVIPSSVLAIGTGAFSDCQLIHSITIPDLLETIEEGAFGTHDDFVFYTKADTIGNQTVYDYVYQSSTGQEIDHGSGVGSNVTIEVKSGIPQMTAANVSVIAQGLASGTYYFVITTSGGSQMKEKIPDHQTLKSIGTSNMYFMDLSLKDTSYEKVDSFTSLTITLPLPSQWTGQNMREYIDVYAMSEDGLLLERIAGDSLLVISEIPYIRFTATHFSEYALVYTSGTTDGGNTSNSGNTGNPSSGSDTGAAPSQGMTGLDGETNQQTIPAGMVEDGASGLSSQQPGDLGSDLQDRRKDETPKTGDLVTYQSAVVMILAGAGIMILLLGNRKNKKYNIL